MGICIKTLVKTRARTHIRTRGWTGAGTGAVLLVVAFGLSSSLRRPSHPLQNAGWSKYPATSSRVAETFKFLSRTFSANSSISAFGPRGIIVIACVSINTKQEEHPWRQKMGLCDRACQHKYEAGGTPVEAEDGLIILERSGCICAQGVYVRGGEDEDEDEDCSDHRAKPTSRANPHERSLGYVRSTLVQL